MTKKKYEIPQMDIVFIHADTPLMSGSVMTPGADNEPPGAPEFIENTDNFEEISKLLFQ